MKIGFKGLGVVLAAAVAAVIGSAAPPSTPARAQTEVDINQGAVQPLPIAIPAFTAPGAAGADISRVVAADLESSGLFRPLDAGTYPERNLDVNVQPRLDQWKTISAQALVNGAVSTDSDGRVRVDFRLWDVGAQQQLLGLQFTSTGENWRRVAHKIADAVYEKLTGEKGYFDTRVVFVAESGGRTSRTKRLGIMDQDGFNPSFLTNGSSLVMSPRFSQTKQEITYMELKPTGSSIYILNLVTGRQETLGRFDGMVFAPRFSPDGDRVAFSVERGGNSDIYLMDLRSRESRRLTTDPSIDTSPSFSPNGAQVVFNSDRAGSPQIYLMNADGSGVRRISWGEGRYTTPVWSPTGDYIAFTKQTGSTFHIGVMKSDGSEERILTTSYLDESPTWAPNGRVLMFEREASSGHPQLWMTDITGRIQRKVAYPGEASDPAWSPLLN